MTSPTPSTGTQSAEEPAYLLPDHEVKRVQTLLAAFDSVNMLHEAEHHSIVRTVVGSIITDITGNRIAPMGIIIATIRAQVRHYNESPPSANTAEPIHHAPATGPEPVPEARDDGRPKGYSGFLVAKVGYTRPRKVVPVYGFVEHWPHGRKVFTGADYDAKHAYRIESGD